MPKNLYVSLLHLFCYTPNAGILGGSCTSFPFFLLLASGFFFTSIYLSYRMTKQSRELANVIQMQHYLFTFHALALKKTFATPPSTGKGAAFLLDFYNYYCCLAHFPPPPSSKSSSVARLLLLLQRNTHKSLVFPHKLLLGPWGYTIVPLACA